MALLLLGCLASGVILGMVIEKLWPLKHRCSFETTQTNAFMSTIERRCRKCGRYQHHYFEDLRDGKIAWREGKHGGALPLEEWHEDLGNVTWWCWMPGDWLGEPAWIGTPLDDDWPGYHTHFTPHPQVPPS